MSAFFKRSVSSSSLSQKEKVAPLSDSEAIDSQRRTSTSSAASTGSATASTSNGLLDPSSAFTSIASGSGSGRASGSTTPKSPRAFASRILSRSSSRQSIKNSKAEDMAPAAMSSDGPAVSGGELSSALEGLSVGDADKGTSSGAGAAANSCATPSPLRNAATNGPASPAGRERSTSPTTPRTPRTPGSAARPSASASSSQPAPGHIGNLSAAQEKKLLDFAQALKDAGILHAFPTPDDPIDVALLSHPLTSATHDKGSTEDLATDTVSLQRIHLLRWLRARNWDIPAAKEMYAKAHAWKFDPAGLDLETKLTSGWTFKEEEIVASNGWRMYFHKTDKLGRPIFIQDLSNINTSSIFSIVTPEQIIEKFAVTLEGAMRYRYADCSHAAQRTVEDNFMILNVEGLGLSTFWAMKNQLQELISILDNNFPELSGRVQIINAPWVFATIFGYIKGWLPPATREKVDIRGADYRETLLEFIREEDLPKSMSGSCTCDQPALDADDDPFSARASAPGTPGEYAGGAPASRTPSATPASSGLRTPSGTGTGSSFRRAANALAASSQQCGRRDLGPWSRSYLDFLKTRPEAREEEARLRAQRQNGNGAANAKDEELKREEADLKAAVEVEVSASVRA